jgi:hypothetical protein
MSIGPNSQASGYKNPARRYPSDWESGVGSGWHPGACAPKMTHSVQFFLPAFEESHSGSE